MPPGTAHPDAVAQNANTVRGDRHYAGAVKQIALAWVERRPARRDLAAYPHLPTTRVQTTSAADYAVPVSVDSTNLLNEASRSSFLP